MSPPNPLDWDDVRVFLAVMRSQSLREAADHLQVSHPTVRRRLDALEARLALRLFDRRPDGLQATPHALELLPAAEDAECALNEMSRLAQAADPKLRGPVRVTMPDILATHLLMPDFAAFCARWPQVDLQIDATYHLADLSKRQADVAIRVMRHGTLPDDSLAGRKAATSYKAVYGSGDCWIGWNGGEADASWIKTSAFPDLPVRGAFGLPEMQLAACQAGMGLAILPCYMGDGLLPRLTEPEPGYDIWVLVHPDLRRNPRLRLFRDAVFEALRNLQPRLRGEVPMAPAT